MRQESDISIFLNVEVRVEGEEPNSASDTTGVVTVRHVRCHLTPKVNITFFITN